MNLIGKVGERYKSIEVSRETFSRFVKLAIRYGDRTPAFSDFTDNMFSYLIAEQQPLTEEHVIEFIDHYDAVAR